jgi:hypothetical protein
MPVMIRNFLMPVFTDSFKLQAQPMFLDTNFNSVGTVQLNLHNAFVESAKKMWAYRKCLPPQKRPGSRLMTSKEFHHFGYGSNNLAETISDVIELAFVLIKSKSKNPKNKQYRCALTHHQVKKIALAAFQTALIQKQSDYTHVMKWIDENDVNDGKDIRRGN